MGKEAIAAITADEARVALRRLDYLRQALPELEEWFTKHPNEKHLWCFRLASLEEGLTRLESFLPEMRKAIQAHAKGDPFGASSSKKRKKAVPTAVEVKAKIDQRASKKKP